MDLNATIFAELLAFLVFLFGCYRWVWPPLVALLDERNARISEGLEAAARGVTSLKLAQAHATEQLRYAKQQKEEILRGARIQASGMIERCNAVAQEQAQSFLKSARTELDQAVINEKEKLQAQASQWIIYAAERILQNQTPVVDEAWIAEVLAQMPHPDGTMQSRED